jgi:hypothetical protein
MALLLCLDGKPPVIPVSSVPVFKFENSLVPASRVPTPVISVSVIAVFHIIFHIYLIKKSFQQGPPAGTTGKSSRQRPPAGITDKSRQQA